MPASPSCGSTSRRCRRRRSTSVHCVQNPRGSSMQTFLRELMDYAEWANAVFFHTWGKSPARDHEEMRQSRRPHHRRPARIPGDLARRGARASSDRVARFFRSVEGSGQDFSRRTSRLCGEPGLRGAVADRSDPLVSGSALCHHGCRGDGSGGDAHATPSRSVYDPAQGFRR